MPLFDVPVPALQLSLLIDAPLNSNGKAVYTVRSIPLYQRETYLRYFEETNATPIIQNDGSLWLQLYDSTKHLPFYYNPMTTCSIWRRPANVKTFIVLRQDDIWLKSGEYQLERTVSTDLLKESLNELKTTRRVKSADADENLNSAIDDHVTHSALSRDESVTSLSEKLKPLEEEPMEPVTESLNEAIVTRHELKKLPPSPIREQYKVEMNIGIFYSSSSSLIENLLQRQLSKQASVLPTPEVSSKSSTINKTPSLQYHVNEQWSCTQYLSKFESAAPRRSSFLSNRPVQTETQWDSDLLNAPFTLIDPKLNRKDVLKIFKDIQRYMKDREEKPAKVNLSDPEKLLSILERAVVNETLVHEVYVQLFKQTSRHPNRVNEARGWQLFWILARHLPPSKQLSPYLIHHATVKSQQPDTTDLGVKWAELCRLQWLDWLRREIIVNQDNEEEDVEPIVTHASIQDGLDALDRQNPLEASLDEQLMRQVESAPHLAIPQVLDAATKAIATATYTPTLFRLEMKREECSKAYRLYEKHATPKECTHQMTAGLIRAWFFSLPDALIADDTEFLEVAYIPELCLRLFEQLPKRQRDTVKSLLIMGQKLLPRKGDYLWLRAMVHDLCYSLATMLFRPHSLDTLQWPVHDVITERHVAVVQTLLEFGKFEE